MQPPRLDILWPEAATSGVRLEPTQDALKEGERDHLSRRSWINHTKVILGYRSALEHRCMSGRGGHTVVKSHA